MDDFFGNGFVYWHWWVLGFALFVGEILTPGTFLMWVGFAALLTGVVAWLVPALGWPADVVLFALLSVGAVGFWFKFRPMRRDDDADNGLNQRGRSYIGRVLTLSKAIHDGIGQARLDDTVWRVAGPDLPSGSRVRVVGSEGTTLRVERAPDEPGREPRD